jgi:hypothetical protein
VSLPLAVEAQRAAKSYRVGFLTGTSVPDLLEAFRLGLRELGWNEGQNLFLEYRSADSKLEKIPELAAELIQRKVDVVVVMATAVYEARQATANTPTVFVIADDPVSAGFVASLARPGGRMTGLTVPDFEQDLYVPVGEVMDLFPDNHQRKDVPTPGPCFDFRAKVPGKMSGGPILGGDGAVVRGVVSRSFSGEKHAYGAMLGPVMRLPLAEDMTLRQMMNSGNEGIAKIQGAGL